MSKTKSLLGNLTNRSDSEKTEETIKTESIKKLGKDYVVKTFNVLKEDFDFIQKYVKFKRMQGETEFTQKETINDALNLLRKKHPEL